MPNTISSLLSRATRQPGEGYNIVSFPTHERSQSLLADTSNKFYLWQGPNIKGWDNSYAKLPENHRLLNPTLGDKQLSPELDVDIVWSQNKWGQYPVAVQLAKHFHCPLICLEHTLPTGPMNNPVGIKQFKTMRGDYNVFITEYSREKWGWAPDEAMVIRHGIDDKLFNNQGLERIPHILSVVNDWKNRGPILGYDIWERVTKGLPVKPVGATPGFSQPAESTEQLAEFYNTSQIFINTSVVSPIPMSLLEAMRCGCAVVSTDNCAISEYIQHGVNGFMTNDEKQMRKYLMQLLNEPDLARQMGQKASKTIAEMCNLERYHKEWQNLFELTDNFVYRG